jgi:hypothetical protein
MYDVDKWLVIACILFFVVLCFGSVMVSTSNKQVFEATLTEKFVDAGYVYFALTKENGETIVCENTDSWILGKVNSADFVPALKEGEKYIFETRGYRFPLLSWYPNIVSFKKVN